MSDNTSNDNKPANAVETTPSQQSHPTGPTSTEGAEASQLEDGGRGGVESDAGHQLDRSLPHHTGETQGSTINNDIGLTGDPEIRRADDEKTLGRHQGDK